MPIKKLNSNTASHTNLSCSVRSAGDWLSSGPQSACNYLLKGKVGVNRPHVPQHSALIASSIDAPFGPYNPISEMKQSYEINFK